MNDPIERQAAIDAVCKAGCGSGFCGVECDEVLALRNLPPAQPEHDENELNFMQPHKRIPVQLVVSSDCISREKAIDIVAPYDEGREMRDALEDLQSVEPEREKGKWIVYYECPECGEITKDFTEYCPFCNADMRGERDG